MPRAPSRSPRKRSPGADAPSAGAEADRTAPASALSWHERLSDAGEVAFVVAYVQAAGALDEAASRVNVTVEAARRMLARPSVREAIAARLKEVELDSSVADIVARELLLDPETPVRERIALISSLHRREESRDTVNVLRELGAPANKMTAEQLFEAADMAGFTFVPKALVRQIQSSSGVLSSSGAQSDSSATVVVDAEVVAS